MAKKKEVTTETPEPVKEPTEKLLALTVRSFFSDGNLGEFFSRYGYSPEWRTTEVRNIPLWLARRCEQSGAELERADE
jgi:hypothetical protein